MYAKVPSTCAHFGKLQGLHCNITVNDGEQREPSQNYPVIIDHLFFDPPICIYVLTVSFDIMYVYVYILVCHHSDYIYIYTVYIYVYPHMTCNLYQLHRDLTASNGEYREPCRNFVNGLRLE